MIRQAKEAYFNKINQSFTYAKPVMSAIATNTRPG